MFHVSIRAAICLWIALLATAGAARAQTTPQIEYLFPPGAQRGTRVDVELDGKFIPGSARWHVAGSDIDLGNGVTPNRATLAISPNAEPGPREVRVFVAQGGSPPHPFLIGELPEIVREPADRPQEIKLPVTINGRLGPTRDIHRYSISLEAGQQVIAAAVTRAISSPVDATLRLLDADSRVVAQSFAHRSADALLTYRAAAAGRYTLEMFDFQLVGGPRSIYRLTVTAGPWLDYAFPAGVQENVASAVTLYGWNLPGGDGRLMQHQVAAHAAGSCPIVLPGGANRLDLVVGSAREEVELEPNDALAEAKPIAVPATINGRLAKLNDVDMWSFTASKGESFAIAVSSADLQFPLDPVLTVKDEAGKTLLEVDDGKGSRDPRLQFTAPADGKYHIALRDRARQGGDDFVYRLSIGPLRPDAKARVDVATFSLQSGQTVPLPVQVERIDGFDGDLEVTAIDLPAGISTAPQMVPKGAAATVQLPLTAAPGLAPTAGLARIVMRRPGQDPAWQREALIAESAQARAGSGQIWLAISPQIPFTLKVATTILDAPRLAAFPFPVSVERRDGFSDPIQLVGVEPDIRGTVVPLTGQVAAGSGAGTIPLVLQQQVTEGTTHRCRVMGVAQVPGADGKLYEVFHVATGNMFLGCQPNYLTMAVEPSMVAARRGTSIPIRIRLMRRVAMESIELRLAIPLATSGLKCEPIVVSKDETEATLTLDIAPDAAFPPRSSITIEAESSRLGLPVYARSNFRLELRETLPAIHGSP